MSSIFKAFLRFSVVSRALFSHLRRYSVHYNSFIAMARRRIIAAWARDKRSRVQLIGRTPAALGKRSRVSRTNPYIRLGKSGVPPSCSTPHAGRETVEVFLDHRRGIHTPIVTVILTNFRFCRPKDLRPSKCRIEDIVVYDPSGARSECQRLGVGSNAHTSPEITASRRTRT